MLNSSGSETKYNLTINLDGTTGIKDLPEGRACFAETSLKVEITDVGPANVTFIQYRLRNSDRWYELTTITGEINAEYNITTCDFIRYVVLVADGVGKLIAAGFFLHKNQPLSFADDKVDVSGSVINQGTSPWIIKEYGDVGLNRDAWGIKKVSLPKTLFHGMFTFDIPSSKWMMYENGAEVSTSTNIVSSNGAASLTTSAVKTSLKIESRVCPRYQPNRGHLFSTAVICPNKTNDGVREWGLCTTENQIMFRLKADGKLYAVLVSDTVQRYEQEIDTSVITNFNVQAGNAYDIQYQWRGVGNYNFYINLTLVHSFNHLGTLTELSIENPALPVCISATRTTQDVSILVGCVDISSENGDDDHLEYGSSYASNVTVNTNTPVIVIRQPLQIGGKTNTRDLTLARITFNCSKKAVFRVWSTRDATGITGATYKPVNSGSFVETDSTDMDATAVRATAVTLNKLRFITAVAVEAAVPREVTNPRPHEVVFPIVRGDYIVVTCTAAAAIADVVVEWGEQI